MRSPRLSARRWRGSAAGGAAFRFLGLRFSTSWSAPGITERFPTFSDDPQLRKWNLWSYVDESHVGSERGVPRSLPTSAAPPRSSSPGENTVMKRASQES